MDGRSETSLPRSSPTVRAVESTSADIPGWQGSRANDQETLGRRKLNKSYAERMKGTEDEVDVETERPRWTEPSARNAELAD